MIHRSFSAILTDLADLLARVNGPHSEWVRERIYSEIPDDLNAWEIWGGEGSIADFTPTEPTDNRGLMESLVELEDAMGAMGLGSPRARQTAQLMEDWLIAHPEYGQYGKKSDA
jgi:hypothetical protein